MFSAFSQNLFCDNKACKDTEIRCFKSKNIYEATFGQASVSISSCYCQQGLIGKKGCPFLSFLALSVHHCGATMSIFSFVCVSLLNHVTCESFGLNESNDSYCPVLLILLSHI